MEEYGDGSDDFRLVVFIVDNILEVNLLYFGVLYYKIYVLDGLILVKDVYEVVDVYVKVVVDVVYVLYMLFYIYLVFGEWDGVVNLN